MNYSLCPACLHFNPAIAEVCNACGASLRGATTTDLPALPELIVSDPEWQPPPVREPKRRAAPAAPPAPTPADVKAAHRAAVRRRRLARTAQPFASLGVRDVLVLDADLVARDRLCGLLDAFGFCAYPADDIEAARALLATRLFAAVFADIVLDGAYGSAEAELCRQVKQASGQDGGRGPALIVVADRAHSVDRVRATLAGADGFLVKPAQRGDVVRALDESGVALPADSRQA